MSDIQQAKSASSDTFVTALVFNAAVFAAEIAVFTLIRPYFKAIYEPRTYIPPPSKRIQPFSPSIFKWPIALYKADYKAIIKANGLDSYFFVRYLRMMVKILLPIWFFSWAILMPVTSVGTNVGTDAGLDRFIFGNVQPDQQARYAAHTVLAYVFTGWILYNIRHELRHFVITRQQHLINPVHAKSVQANTLLVTGIPAKYLNHAALLNLYKDLPGGVKKIWINRNLKELPDLYDRRLDACAKLESAETSLLSTTAKLRLKAAKQKAKKSKAVNDVEAEAASDDKFIVPRADRPQHRLGSIPFFGKKVDTIEWAREEIRICTALLEEGRAVIDRDDRGTSQENVPLTDTEILEKENEPKREKDDKKIDSKPKCYPPLNSAFITFHRQIAAHLGMQVLTHHEPYRMSGRFVEVSPEDVIWANLGLNPYEMKVRMVISYAITAGLIIFWTLPVAFIGMVSNVHTLCTTASWLAWVCDLPAPVVGIISGILPPVMLAILMMLLPIVLRLLAHFEGIPKRTGLELSLMTRFFIFQVVHSFLIVTISSGIIASLAQLINSPTSVPTILAQSLPQASTFFLTYIILQGLAGTASGFLQIVTLLIYYVKLFLLGSTPRSVYGIKYGARSVTWGTLFPNITLLVVITLGYSIISPIINGLACATFFAFYQMYKYLFLWQFIQSPESDTGGLFFPKAIQHVFAGLYIQEICLCALFFLAQNENGDPGALPQGILMVVLIVITVFFHIIMNNSYGPLIHPLPLSLADKTYGAPSAADTHAEIDQSASPISRKSREAGSSVERDAGFNAFSGSDSIHESERDPLTDLPRASRSTTSANVGTSRDPKSIEKKREEEYGFAHPATSRPQRTIWIPKDEYGLAEEEERACLEAGIDASVRDAVMNEKGKVDIRGAPPDIVSEE